jgi:hypothetical protein
MIEPYSIYVYRYFLNQWSELCYMVRDFGANLESKPKLSLPGT